MSVTGQQLSEKMPHKWRVQSVNQYGAVCVAYIDSRQVMDVLDDVVGEQSWQSIFYELKGRIFCKIGIEFDKGHWVWKSDCGSESNIEKEKGESSDAFKRAAVHWGIGRFLYSLDIVRLKSVDKNGKWVACDNSGKAIYGDEITRICNQGQPKEKPKAKPELKPGTEQWESAKSYLMEKGHTIEQVKKKYKITATNEADVIAETINDAVS